MTERCAHLETVEGFWIHPQTGAAVADKGYQCLWPLANALRLADAPTWFAKRIGPSPSIVPEHDCPGCLAFKTPRPKHEPEVRSP